MGIGQLLEVFFHSLDNLAISRYDRFSFLSYPKHILNSIANLFSKQKYEILLESTDELSFGFKINQEWTIKCIPIKDDNRLCVLNELDEQDCVLEYSTQTLGPGSDGLVGYIDLKAASAHILNNLKKVYPADTYGTVQPQQQQMKALRGSYWTILYDSPIVYYKDFNKNWYAFTVFIFLPKFGFLRLIFNFLVEPPFEDQVKQKFDFADSILARFFYSDLR